MEYNKTLGRIKGFAKLVFVFTPAILGAIGFAHGTAIFMHAETMVDLIKGFVFAGSSLIIGFMGTLFFGEFVS